MINTNLLKAKLKEKNYTQEKMTRLFGINPSTFNKKINNYIEENFTIEEATKLSKNTISNKGGINMNIKAINNFLRKNKTIFEKIRKIENIKDSRLRGQAVDGFCLEFKIDKFDVYYEINRLIKNLKNGYFDKIDLETLLDKTDISKGEMVTITELATTGNIYIRHKETLDIVETAKEILDLLEIKWEKDKTGNFHVLRIVRR